ncbi:TIGR02594 family protein [Hyphobacterium sp.]|uniref:TIGR02594 family protein n=1 Tax=Hyphobacterium sp. TaxID=2004662 RepID=UPI003BAB004A
MSYALPNAYEFLAHEPAPRMLLEALKLYGTLEAPGARDNPVILAWADELAQAPGLNWIGSWYEDDSIPWCGLFMGIVAHRAKKPVQGDLLSARGWLDWGNRVEGEPKLGDVLVFWRGNPAGSSGHVGLYVGEDREHYHVLGGNQSDAVNVTRISKQRLLAARNLYTIGQPPNCRRIRLDVGGAVSENEQ